MVQIENFEQGLQYVLGLGFTVRPGFPGWILAAQKRLCDTEQALHDAAGGYPYNVHYHRKDQRFEVTPIGKTVFVDATNL